MNALFNQIMVQPFCTSSGAKVTYVMDLKAISDVIQNSRVTFMPNQKQFDLVDL